jgi:thiol-disulfide isomerase/thioredoxin
MLSKFIIALVFVSALSSHIFAQKTDGEKALPTTVALPKVTQINEIALKNLLKPNGKPLLVNFWATWCDPCREEFPDLVKIDQDYKNKIDFITVSTDNLAEINRDVPKFLSEMKAEMPSYLLKTGNEDAAIMMVSKNWQGGLPFTILFNEKGETVYFRQGKVKIDILRAALEKLTAKPVAITDTQIFDLSQVKPPVRSDADGKADAEKDIAAGILKIKRYGLTIAIPSETLVRLKTKYNIEIVENGCVLVYVTPGYFKAYNDVMRAEIRKRFGAEVLAKIPWNENL